MRFGTIHEDYTIIAYLMAEGHANRTFEEVGWCNAPRNAYPPTWGASPDGIIRNPEMKWSYIPVDIRKYYAESDWDVTKGVAEFKCSTANCDMLAYYYPQLYMEMIATKTLWADLVRYSETRETDTDGTWNLVRTCRVFRVYRHKPTEDLIVSLIKDSLANKKDLINWVQTEPYKDIRSYFSRLAQNAKYIELDIGKDSNIATVIENYEAHKRQVIRGYLGEPDQDDEEEATGQIWDEIDKNNMDMFRYFEEHNVQKFSQLYANQVHMYTQLMDSMWE